MAKKFAINIKTIFDGGVTKLVAGLERGIKRARAFGAALRKGMHSAPVRLLRNALAVLVGTLAAGTMQAAKFNVERARAWTMSSPGVGWFRKMRQEVRELSGELGVATEQLSGGLYQALSAGVPEDNVLEFLKTAAKIAVADGSDVAVAVDGMTTVLNAFKIEASETEAVADLLFNTVASGKTTFAELAQSLATVAPIAAANGVAFEEVLAAVATLTKQGTPTAQAMTQIRAAIVGTNKALGDGWAKSMSLQKAFKKIAEQAGGSQTALQKMLGTIEGVQGVLGLTGINAQMAAADLEGTARAAGSVETAFKKVDQFRHWQKLWKNISGLVERTAEEADSRLGPAILRIVEDLAKIQEDDDLWGGLGESLDEAMGHIANILEYIQSEGKSGAAEVMDSLGLILLGHAQNGAQEAIALLAKWMPVLGLEFAKAAISVITHSGQDKPDPLRKAQLFDQASAEVGPWHPIKQDRRYKELLAEEKVKNARKRLIEQGGDLGDAVGSGIGDVNIKEGWAGLREDSDKGEVVKTERKNEQQAQQLAAASEVERLRALQDKVDENARIAPLGGGTEALHGFVQRQTLEGENPAANAIEKREASIVPAMAKDIAAASEKENQLLAQYLQATGNSLNDVVRHLATQNQNMQDIYQKLQMLQSQVKNGRS